MSTSYHFSEENKRRHNLLVFLVQSLRWIPGRSQTRWAWCCLRCRWEPPWILQQSVEKQRQLCKCKKYTRKWNAARLRAWLFMALGNPSLDGGGGGGGACEVWDFNFMYKKKKAFQYDAYRPRYNKDEHWPSSNEADYGQNDRRLWKHYLPPAVGEKNKTFQQDAYRPLAHCTCYSGHQMST